VAANHLYGMQKLPVNLLCKTIHHLINRERKFEPESIHLFFSAETHIVYAYHIDNSLGTVPREVSRHLDPITVREDRGNQRDALICGEVFAGQFFPGWRVWAICGQLTGLVMG